jgi:hypothetical protein
MDAHNREALMEYGTILVAADDPEEVLMLLSTEPSEPDDWNAVTLTGPALGRIVWLPGEVLRGDDPAYVEAPR